MRAEGRGGGRRRGEGEGRREWEGGEGGRGYWRKGG